MEGFSNWFVSFFQKFFTNLWLLIKGFFVGLYNLVIGYWITYFKDFKLASKSFGFIDWLLSVVIIMVFMFLVFMVVVVIVQLIRKYFRFTKIEHDKMTLLNQMNLLEKRIRDTSVINISSPRLNPLTPTLKKDQKIRGTRFTKLNLIDEKYSYTVLPTKMEDNHKMTLSSLVEAFVNYASFYHNLYYTKEVAAIFIAGMATSKILILEGISGTGKTSLPYVFGRFISNNASIISVQPSWRDRYEMMGYFNEFTKKFNETEFLSSIYEATFRSDINIIVLDEMNLARVEYYFADFLSLLELPDSSEWQLEVVPEQIMGDPIHLKEGKIQIPENIWFVGTANNDDSTFAITDKVYDRASSIQMNKKANPFKGKKTEPVTISYEYINNLFKEALESYSISEKSLESLEKVDTYISEVFQITFGNRIMKQLLTFVPVYMACGMSEIEGIDYIISRKIIRKFETLNLPFLKRELEDLIEMLDKFFGKNKLKETIDMINRFIKQV